MSLKDNLMRGNRVDLAGRGDTSDPTPGPPALVSIPDQAVDGGGNTFTTGGFDVCVENTGDE